MILQAEEELDEEERKQAWLEYEEEKKGKPMIMTYQNSVLQQQFNIIRSAEQAGLLPPNFSLQKEYGNLQHFIQKDVSTIDLIMLYFIYETLKNDFV